jgi:hypothetical protein
MKLPTIDQKMQWVARIFFIAFASMLYELVFVGEYSYYSMGHERFVTAQANPYKFYLGIVWYSLMTLVSGVFGFIAKRK